MILNSPFISGSLTVTGNTIISGSITAPAGIAGTASYASNAELLDGLDSTSFTTTSSFNAASSSFSTRVANTEATASQYVAASASFDSRIITNDSTDTTQNARLLSNEQKTGSFATTGSNYFIGTQVITGSVYISSDLIVQGSSSLQNITASAVSIGTNTVILNTDSPAVRFAGISVRDSGSNSAVTSSIWYDSLNNKWIYQNESGSSYSGGMFISGPRNTGSLGDEAGMTNGYIAKGLGGDHIGPSIIFETGSSIGIGTASPSYNLDVIGTGRFNGTSGIFIGVTINNSDASGSSRLRVTSTGDNITDVISYSAAHASRANQAWIGGDGSSTITVLQAGGVEFLRGASTGAATFSSTISLADDLTLASTNPQIKWNAGNLRFTSLTAGNVMMTITQAGNVMINTTTDAGYKLDVNGTGRFGASTYRMLSISDAGGAGWATTGGASTAPQLYMYNTGTSAIVQTYINNVARLEVTNTGIAVTGAATFSSSVTAKNGLVSWSAGSAANLLMNDLSGNNKWEIGYEASPNNFYIYSYAGNISPLKLNPSTGAATFSSSVTATGGVNAGDSKFFNSVQLTDSLGGTCQGFLWTDAANTLKIGTGTVAGGNVKMTILSGGNVGIGTTSPTNAKLHITTTTGANFQNAIRLEKAGGYGESVIQNYYTSVSNYGLGFDVEGATRMVINNAGNIGIGITAPSQKLHVVGGTSITAGNSNWFRRTYEINVTTWSDVVSFNPEGSDQYGYGYINITANAYINGGGFGVNTSRWYYSISNGTVNVGVVGTDITTGSPPSIRLTVSSNIIIVQVQSYNTGQTAFTSVFVDAMLGSGYLNGTSWVIS